MNYNILCFLSENSRCILSGVLSATMAGSLAYILWLFLSKRAAKFVVKHAMTYLKINMVCFVVLILLFGLRQMLMGANIVRRNMSSTTPIIIFLLVLSALWVVTTVIVLIYRYSGCRDKRFLCAMNKPVEDENILKLLDKWKERLGISQRVMVFYNEVISSPAIIYNHGYQVLLPLYSMSEKEISISLLHELMHLKHGDIRTKDAGFIVNALHSFNPVSYFLREEIEKWAEVSCDWSCCEIGEEEFSSKDYFDCILEMKERSRESSYPDIVCCLFENKKLINFRIDTMKGRRGEKAGHRIRGTVAIAVLMMVIMAVSFRSVSVGFQYWVEESLNCVEEKPQEKGIRRASQEDIFDGARVNCWDGNIIDQTQSTDFELGTREIKVFEIPETCEDTVIVAVMCAEGEYQLGCIGEEGHIDYVDSSQSTTLKFEMQDENVEQFFIKNTGDTPCRMELFLSSKLGK